MRNDTTAITANSARKSPNRLMTCASHTLRITSMRSTSRNVKGAAGAAGAPAVAAAVDMGSPDYTLAPASASSNSSYDARRSRAIVAQSGCAVCSSRSAAAFARSNAAAATFDGVVSYSSAYSSAIKAPTWSGLFCPGTRRAAHHSSSARATHRTGLLPLLGAQLREVGALGFLDELAVAFRIDERVRAARRGALRLLLEAEHAPVLGDEDVGLQIAQQPEGARVVIGNRPHPRVVDPMHAVGDRHAADASDV